MKDESRCRHNHPSSFRLHPLSLPLSSNLKTNSHIYRLKSSYTMRSTACTLAFLLAIACASKRPDVQSSKQSQPAKLAVQVTFPDSSTGTTFNQTQFDQHIAQLKKKIPSADFSIVVQP